ncbi:N-acetyltransferase family protein [Microvirga sp. M2]|uniref:GNAT family N-acetyltransferase n=1 Tax=Microvirga sp. M2 TaxID=3073270 RepID=UPI0039C4D698
MNIDLRPARSDDYAFARDLYVEAIGPLARTWTEWCDEDQRTRFASLWRPAETWILVLDGREDIGWVEVRQTGDEIFLKQLHIAPTRRGRGIGSTIIRRLMEKRRGTAKSIALFVLKNNPAVRFYERHGFSIASETTTNFVMRREMDGAA